MFLGNDMTNNVSYPSQAVTVKTSPWVNTDNFAPLVWQTHEGATFISLRAITGSTDNVDITMDTDNWFRLIPPAAGLVSDSLLTADGQILVRSNGINRALNIGATGTFLVRRGSRVIWASAASGSARATYLPLTLNEINAPRQDSGGSYQMFHPSPDRNGGIFWFGGFCELGRTGRAQFDFGGAGKDKIRTDDRDFYMRKPNLAVTQSDSPDGYIRNGRFYHPNTNRAYGRYFRSGRWANGTAPTRATGYNYNLSLTTYREINRLEQTAPGTRSLDLGIDMDGNWSRFQQVEASDSTTGLRVLDWIRTEGEYFIFICNPLSSAAGTATSTDRDLYVVGGIDFTGIANATDLAGTTNSIPTTPRVSTDRTASEKHANMTPYEFRFRTITRVSNASSSFEKLFLYDPHNMYSSQLRIPVAASVISSEFLCRLGDGTFERWDLEATSNPPYTRAGVLAGATNRDHIAITSENRRGASATRAGVNGHGIWEVLRNVLQPSCAIRAVRVNDTSLTVNYRNDTPNNLANGVRSTEVPAYQAGQTITLTLPAGQTLKKIKVLQYPNNNYGYHDSPVSVVNDFYFRSFDAAIFVITDEGNIYAARLGNQDPSNLFEAVNVLDFSTIAAGGTSEMTLFSNTNWDGMVKDIEVHDSETLTECIFRERIGADQPHDDRIAFVHNRCVAITTSHTPNRIYLHGLNRNNVLSASALATSFQTYTTAPFFIQEAPLAANSLINGSIHTLLNVTNSNTSSHSINSTTTYARGIVPVNTIDRIVFGALTHHKRDDAVTMENRFENHVYIQSGDQVYISRINADNEIIFTKYIQGNESLYSGYSQNVGVHLGFRTDNFKNEVSIYSKNGGAPNSSTTGYPTDAPTDTQQITRSRHPIEHV